MSVGQELFGDSDAEYWSRVENIRGVPTIKMVLKRMELCRSCKSFHSVYVITPYGARCESCTKGQGQNNWQSKESKELEVV